jgi:hypothetical protein
MSTLRPDWPATPNFRPEFGLLCLSPQARRRMRLALVGAMTGMVIGAAIELAVVHRNDADAGVSIPVADSIDAQPPAPRTAVPEVTGVPKVSARALERAGNTVEAAVASPPGGCRDAAAKDAAASLIGPTCRSGKPHLPHTARTGNRVATVIVASVGAPVTPTEVEPAPITGGRARADPSFGGRHDEAGPDAGAADGWALDAGAAKADDGGRPPCAPGQYRRQRLCGRAVVRSRGSESLRCARGRPAVQLCRTI